MRVTPYGVVGAEVHDLDLAELPAVTGSGPRGAADPWAEEWAALLAEHGVLVVRDQHLDDAGFAAVLRRFGDPVFTVGETPVPGFDDLNVISNAGRTTPPRSTFHVDTSYVSRPPAYTALRAVTVPAQGGETLFSNQYRAHDTLHDVEPGLRERLAGVRIVHRVTGVDPGAEQEHEAEHPVLRPHPLTGRMALYLTTPARCAAVHGLPEHDADGTDGTVGAEAGRSLVERLYEHSTAEANLLRHRWRPGDVVMWDNGAVLHRADHSGVVGDRVMHRGMATGYASR